MNVKVERLVLNLGCGEQTYGDVRVDIYRSKAVNILADAEQFLPFRNSAFDEVYSSHFFEHLRNASAGLSEMVRVLKPNGKLIIAHALSSAEIKAHHHNASPAVAKDVLPEKATMKQLLKQAGFTRIHIIDKPGCYLCLSNKSTP